MELFSATNYTCRRLALLAVFGLGIHFAARATHLRGGYIRAERLTSDNLTYRIRVISFTDAGSSVSSGGGEISFGDGSVIELDEGGTYVNTSYLGNEVSYSEIEVVHAFPAYGIYTIELKEYYRNAGVANIENSVAAPFYVETTIVVDPAVAGNSTPRLITTPAMRTKAGTRFFGSIACSDGEGDSLVYSLASPKQFFGSEDGKEGDAFKFSWPNSEEFYLGKDDIEDPQLSVDNLSGQLIWDTPLLEAEFALAYKVLEYRKVNGAWWKISESLVDFQLINSFESDNPPVIDFSYVVEARGKIGFEVRYESADSIQWEFFSDHPFIFENHRKEGGLLGGQDVGNFRFSGTIEADADSEKPITILAKAAKKSLYSNYSTIKSFAIHPAGKEYVLTAVNGEAKLKPVVFPNPSTDQLNVLLPAECAGCFLDMQLLDLSGKSILRDGQMLSGKLATFRLEGIPTGIYLLALSVDGKAHRMKIVKN